MRARRTSAPDRRDGKRRGRAAGLLVRRARKSPPRPPAPEGASETEQREAADLPAQPADRDLFHERRLRDSGGPEDVATYTCGCGLVWEAPVTASVTCPHCGAPQAW